ncbi:MAG: hypothetical protein MZV65_14605 [Chromatiales bacterium]|nr:hypothetical protein [Chromatiales bacterium]
MTPHALYLAMGLSETERQAAYRALFRAHLEEAAIDDIRLALNQSQPLGNARFLAKIEQMTGRRREAKPRGRPRVQDRSVEPAAVGQGKLAIE